MNINLDSHTITISCPQCGKQLEEKIGRLKREKHIVCIKCGRVAIDTDKLRSIENSINKDIGKSLSKRSSTVKINLKL